MRSAPTNSTGEISPPAPPTASASALRGSCAVGSGEEPPANHRVVLWSSVISVEVDPPDVGGDIHLVRMVGVHQQRQDQCDEGRDSQEQLRASHRRIIAQ
jgi:hypothetical protein